MERFERFICVDPTPTLTKGKMYSGVKTTIISSWSFDRIKVISVQNDNGRWINVNPKRLKVVS